jgi:hypothetical protein
MKKVILIMLVAVLGAITVNAQLNFGIKAGFNASTIINANQSIEDSDFYSYKPGFNIGVAAQYLLSPQFGIESGLYYSTLGIKGSSSIETDLPFLGKHKVEETQTASPSYLQLPISVFYKFEVGTGLSLYPDAGIYLGYGLGGKAKSETKVDGKKVDESSVESDYFGDKTNKFDLGLTFGLNLQYDKFVIGLGYDLGLTKLNKDKFEYKDAKDLKNGNIKVSVGYFF